MRAIRTSARRPSCWRRCRPGPGLTTWPGCCGSTTSSLSASPPAPTRKPGGRCPRRCRHLGDRPGRRPCVPGAPRGSREDRLIAASVRAGRHAELLEQVREELPEQGVGTHGILELGGTEPEDLVPGELELAVAADALGVRDGVWASVGAVVGGAVYLEDDPVAVGQQEQEVHAEIQ